jgi:hypothetical protein
MPALFRRSAMQSETEDMLAVRREMLDLLREQMEALDSPLGLTDEQLKQCYDRQARTGLAREASQRECKRGGGAVVGERGCRCFV